MVATKFYYIVKAKPSLLEAGSGWHEEAMEFVNEPQCWENIEISPQIEKAKLAFLINIYTEYAFPEIIKLLGEKAISLGTFDRWWGIERYALFGGVNEFGSKFLPQDAVEFTNDENLNFWLAEKIKDI